MLGGTNIIIVVILLVGLHCRHHRNHDDLRNHAMRECEIHHKKSHVSDAISLAWAEEIVVVRPPSSAGFETIPNPQHTASTKEWQL